MKNILVILTGLVILIGCGDPAVDVSDVEYKPKITVEGYVYPGEQIKDIYLTRNYRLGVAIDTTEVFLLPADNEVAATVNGVPLQFDPVTFSYYANLMGDYNTSYELRVSAKIDGQVIQTSTVTTTPSSGFHILNNNLGNLTYQEDEVNIEFTPSPGTDFYAFSIRADSTSLENFIYDNPYIPNIDKDELAEDYKDYGYEYDLLINIDSYSNVPIEYEVSGLNTWFYSSYTVYVYAGDKNFKDYMLTARNVQQTDGNFVEPEFHFTGDGIGVFGSAIRDTVTFNLLKAN